MTKQRVLVVDDEPSMRQFLQILLEREGHEVRTASSGEEALMQMGAWWPGLILTDLNMPGMSGMDLLREAKTQGVRTNRDVQVVMVTAYGTTELGAVYSGTGPKPLDPIEAVKAGAADYILKPFNNEELRLVVRRVLGRSALELENTRLRSELRHRFHYESLVGSSKSMNDVYELIRRVKDTRINCLIAGESGTGKELVARAIHYSGNRAKQPFVAINCGAIPENLVESELFGHKKGSFTGAVREKPGLFSAADGGTLFLDEVNALPLNVQVKVLRAIQERSFTPVGATDEVQVDVRIIAATNQDLENLVEEGAFRDDLYYRLNVVQIRLPPLRERSEDLEVLARHFIRRFAEEYSKQVSGFSTEALRALKLWAFPGNVRELQNIVERAVALCMGTMIELEDLPERMRAVKQPSIQNDDEVSFPDEGVNLDGVLAAVEKRWLVAALDVTGGNKTRAATLLQMSFRSFRYRLAKYDLDHDA